MDPVSHIRIVALSLKAVLQYWAKFVKDGWSGLEVEVHFQKRLPKVWIIRLFYESHAKYHLYRD